jgi:hypothetical protein
MDILNNTINNEHEIIKYGGTCVICMTYILPQMVQHNCNTVMCKQCNTGSVYPGYLTIKFINEQKQNLRVFIYVCNLVLCMQLGSIYIILYFTKRHI